MTQITTISHNSVFIPVADNWEDNWIIFQGSPTGLQLVKMGLYEQHYPSTILYQIVLEGKNENPMIALFESTDKKGVLLEYLFILTLSQPITRNFIEDRSDWEFV